MDDRTKTLHAIGTDAEDFLEAAQLEQAGHKGACLALKKTALGAQDFLADVDRDLKAGLLVNRSPVEVAEYSKQQIERVIEALQQAALYYDVQGMVSGGTVLAYERMAEHIKKTLED